jgi:hypothetical protein
LKRIGVLALALLGTPACATTKPSARTAPPGVATLQTEDTKIDEVDGQPFSFATGSGQNGFELPPGPHELGVSVFVVQGGPDAFASDFRRSQVRVMCFDALPGHAYLTRPAGPVTRGVPELVDLTSGQVVGAACGSPPPP